MKYSYRHFFILTIFIIPMLACSSFFGSDEEEAPATNSDTVTAAESATESEGSTDPTTANNEQAEGDANAVTASADDPTAASITSLLPRLPFNSDLLPFDTYRILMEFAATTADVPASFQMDIARDVPNQSISYQMTANGVPDMDELPGGSMRFVVFQGNAYMPIEGECMLVPAGAGSPMDEIFSQDDSFFGEDQVGVQYISSGTMFGLPVATYQVTDIGDEEIEEVNGTITVHTTANGEQILFKSNMTGTSAQNPLTDAEGQSNVTFNIEIVEANGPVEIAIPAGCENPVQLPGVTAPAQSDGQSDGAAATGSPSGYPVYPGAAFIGGIAGTENYLISQSAIDAAQAEPKDFYMQEMAIQGWTLTQEQPLGPATSLSFVSAEGQNIQVMIVTEGSDVNVTFIGGLP